MAEAAPQQASASGAVTAIGALAGLAAAAGIAGKRAAKNRTSMKAVGVGRPDLNQGGRPVWWTRESQPGAILGYFGFWVPWPPWLYA